MIINSISYEKLTIEQIDSLKEFDLVCDGDKKQIIAYKKEDK